MFFDYECSEDWQWFHRVFFPSPYPGRKMPKYQRVASWWSDCTYECERAIVYLNRYDGNV